MAKVSPEAAEVDARIVYWGIEGAGKRTCLRSVAKKLRTDNRGEMRSVPTRFDPSVEYTVLPIELGEIAGMRTRIEMIAVPGEPEHAPTRKQLLDQVDGIVLVIDSQPERFDENVAAVEELRKAVEDYALHLDEMPLVVQYNKRDLADAYDVEALHRRLGLGSTTVFETVATDGTGLLQSLSTISKKVIRALREQSFGVAAAPAPSAKPAPEPEPTPEPKPMRAPAAALEPPPSPLAGADAPTPGESLEDAILRAGDDPDPHLDAEVQSAESLLDEQPWHHGPDEFDSSPGARLGPDLSIVSVGETTRVDHRSVRIPLVLGDGDGETSTLVLTVSLDAVVDESSG